MPGVRFTIGGQGRAREPLSRARRQLAAGRERPAHAGNPTTACRRSQPPCLVQPTGSRCAGQVPQPNSLISFCPVDLERHNALALSCGPDRGRGADPPQRFPAALRQPYTPTASAPCYAGSTVHDRWPRPGPRTPLSRSPATRFAPGTSGARRKPRHRLPTEPAPRPDRPTSSRCAGQVAPPSHR
jgi:hypothetical protein